MDFYFKKSVFYSILLFWFRLQMFKSKLSKVFESNVVLKQSTVCLSFPCLYFKHYIESVFIMCI